MVPSSWISSSSDALKITQDVVIAGRYQLVDRLGSGAMGEVWRAQDTRFESRTVAVKFLREDETLKEDALNRDRLVIRLEQQAARGGLSLQSAIEAVASALGASNLEGLRARAESSLGSRTPLRPGDVVTVFDELVNDPTFNDNARMRAKLRRLFRDEANAVANLRHDNIVSIFDYGDHEGCPYLVMDYIEGRTLYQVIQGQEMLSRSRRLRLIEDLCAGLGYAHRHKLVHRDIKPANLIIDGSTGSLKILDFGVVRRLGSASTVGVPVGTFCYMSPEQTKGAASLDHRSDIFAVGLVFYELMSFRKAFPPGKSIGDLVARIQRDPPPSLVSLVPSIPKTIEDIITKAVQKQPESRYQDLSIMEREIARVRTKIEAAEQSESSVVTNVIDATIVKPRPALPTLAELLATAERAFEAGDLAKTLDLCGKALIVQPGAPAAVALRAKVEARQRDAKVQDFLQQAAKFMALEELASAEASLERAREIDASAPSLKAAQDKLQAAVEARSARDRALRERQAAEQRDREQREIEQREQQAREEQARAEQARLQHERELAERRERQQREQLEIEARDKEQREREQRDREQRERADRDRERAESQQRAPVRPAPLADHDEPTAVTGAVTMQLPRAVIRPPMVPLPPPPASPPPAATSPPPAANTAASQTRMPAAPVTTPPAKAPPPAPPPSQTSKPGGPSRKSQRVTVKAVPAQPAAAPIVPAVAPPRVAPSPSSKPAPAPLSGPGLVAPATRAGVSPKSLGIAAAVIVLLLGGVAVVLFLQPGRPAPSPQSPGASAPAPSAPARSEPSVPVSTPPATPPPEAAPAPAQTAETPALPAEAPAPPMMTTVYIDVRPWARVKIIPAVPNPAVPTDTFYAPFAVDLPAGAYTLEAENGGVSRAAVFPLKVSEGGSQVFVRTMPGFNAAKIVEGLLGQNE